MQNLPWAKGILAGVTAYVTGLSVTALFLVFRLLNKSEWRELVSSGQVNRLDIIGWTYYSSIFVGISSAEKGPFGENVNLILEASPEPLNAILLFISPILILMIAGFAVPNPRKVEELSYNDAAASGALITIGYVLFVLIGTSIFSFTMSGRTARPDLGYAIMMGLIYPIIFGSIGGVLGREQN